MLRAMKFFPHRYPSKPEQNENAQRNMIGNRLKYINNVRVCAHVDWEREKGEQRMLLFARNF